MTLDPKHAWQSSVEVGGLPPMEEVRAGADRFYRAVRRRNWIEYAACVVVVLSFTRSVVIMADFAMRIGAAWIVFATFYAAWQLHRRGSAERSDAAGTLPIYLHLRGQLVRQREALKGVFWWYILPFLPGFVLILGAGLWAKALSGVLSWRDAVGTAALLAILVGIWWLNQLGARKLQRRIDEIDALVGGEA